VADGNDLEAVDNAIKLAQAVADQPSIIAVRTIIGFGAPHKQNSFEVHGSPLGEEELLAAKANLGWPTDQKFLIPGEALENFRQAPATGAEAEGAWQARLAQYEKAFPEPAAEFKRRMAGELPAGWDKYLPTFAPDPKGLATRKAGQKVIGVLGKRLPELMGGSADLDPSTFTNLEGEGDFENPGLPHENAQGTNGEPWGYAGRNIHFGVREHGMGAVVNGLSTHGGFISYGATFLVFSDYMRPTIRLSAIMQVGSIWIYTHDSIGLGEDGPTHQAVEHYAALRAIPHLLFIRPGDANEVTWAWQVAI